VSIDVSSGAEMAPRVGKKRADPADLQARDRPDTAFVGTLAPAGTGRRRGRESARKGSVGLLLAGASEDLFVPAGAILALEVRAGDDREA
jgi:hypothetical protein